MILQLNASQVLLNKLYIPISKGNIATMVKSKEDSTYMWLKREIGCQVTTLIQKKEIKI